MKPSESLKNQKSGGEAAKDGRPTAGRAAATQPTMEQRRFLERGLGQPGGKVPRFDQDGREVPARTALACLEKGWVEPWFANPLKPDWLVVKLTREGLRVASRGGTD